MVETNKFEIKHPRPLLVWSQTVNNFSSINSAILEIINSQRLANPTGITDNINVNVWQSNWNMDHYDGFKDVANEAKNLTKHVAEQFLNFKNFNPYIVDCWTNVYPTGGYCNIHSHFPATFAVVYYVKVPENSGDIVFPDADLKITPYNGLMLCFKGDVWHGVEANKTDEDRIIIGINITYNPGF